MARRSRSTPRCHILYLRGSRLSELYPRDQYRYMAPLLPQKTEMEIYPCIQLGREDRGIELEGKGVFPLEGIF